MRTILVAVLIGLGSLSGCSGPDDGTATDASAPSTQDRNKRLAAEFYENLWFTENTNVFADYVAEEYVVHDVGERKNVTEPARAQKEIADLFHGFGELTGEIDYQIAEGDKVATRWFISMNPNEQAQEVGMTQIVRVPIINVFRFDDDGKIVEIWNHRHDVDLPQPPGNRESKPEG